MTNGLCVIGYTLAAMPCDLLQRVKFGERTYRIPDKSVIAQLKSSDYDHLVRPDTWD